MVSSRTEAFASAVREVDASVTVTTAADLPDALADAVEEPAIGTELPFEGVDYADAPVDPDPTTGDLLDARTGVTAGALGVVDYGSVVLEESGRGEELLGLYPDHHVVVVAASDVVDDMPAAIDAIGERAQSAAADAIVATGPSATADMGAVVTGVHGPRTVHVVVLEDR